MSSLSWIRSLFQKLHGHQQKTLAFFVDALLVEQRVGLAHIARRAAGQRDGSLRGALKRLWRFLGNSRFKDDIVSAGVIDWIWPRIRQWKYVPISIDWTHNERRDPWETITASISLHGRGIPLSMWSFRKADYEEYPSRNRAEQAFIRHLFGLLPDDKRIVLLADRGFGRAELLEWLDEEGIAFVIRVARTSKVRGQRYSGHLHDLVVHNGECYSLGAVVFTDSHSVQLRNLVVARQEQANKADPWLLATNTNARATTVARLYARRMIIEQDFKEAKSRLDWGDSRVRKRTHYRRLTTLVLLALVFAALIGRVAGRRPTLAAKVARRRKSVWDHSYTALGLLLLRLGLDYLSLIHQTKFPAQPI